MGREIRRVPLDFDWPIGETWIGFLNPFHTAKTCPDCKGSGLTPEAKRISDQWYGWDAPFDPSETGSEMLTVDNPAVRALAERNIPSGDEFWILREAERLIGMWNTAWCHHLDQDDVDALIKENRLWDFTKNGIESPTAEQVNQWSIGPGFGHDAINSWVCVRAKCERLGITQHCATCDGEAEVWHSKAAEALYESWEDIPPPIGDGTQVWETVSEGSPVSPVFADKQGAIGWLVSEGYNPEGAAAFVESGWSISFVGDSSGLQNGIDALAKLT